MQLVLTRSQTFANLRPPSYSKLSISKVPRLAQVHNQADSNECTVATNLRCGDAPNKLECLRAVPFADLQAALSLVPAQPVPDGDIYTVDRKQRLLDGNFHKIPAIFGHCTDEGASAALLDGPRSPHAHSCQLASNAQRH